MEYNSHPLLSCSYTHGSACTDPETGMPFASTHGGSNARLWHCKDHATDSQVFPTSLLCWLVSGDLVQPASAALCAAGAWDRRLSRGGLELHSNAQHPSAEVI